MKAIRLVDAQRLKTIRVEAANLVRSIRSDFPTLRGDWTRRQWNEQARKAGRRYITNMCLFFARNAE